MIFKEYGDKSLPKVVLFHPMFTGSNAFTKLAEEMGDKYCYVIPDFSAHGEDKSEFISAQREAETVKEYLNINHYNEIELLMGASMGAVVALYVITDSTINFKTIILDGAPVYKNADMFYYLLSFIMQSKQKKASKNPKLGIQKMSKLYGELGKSMAASLTNMSTKSMRNILWACSHFDFPTYSDEQQKRIFFQFGSKDIYLKQAKVIKDKYPDVSISVNENYGHCEFLANNYREYAVMIKNYMRTHADI